MQAFVIGVITTAIGVIVGILVPRHYFVRSVKHRLAVYYMPSPSIFYGVDPEIRSGLSIQFRGETVKELSVIEFLVANEGTDAIRQSIDPLTFGVSSDCKIVDVSVTYVQPEGREITVEIVPDRKFRCKFPLLNPREYFYIKLITDGPVRPSDVQCTITAEGLPPRIRLESAAGVNIGPESTRSLGVFVGSVVVFLIGACLTLPMVGLYEAHPQYFPFAWSKWHFVWWLTPALFIVAILALIIMVFAVGIGFSSIFGSIPRRPSFKRPGRPHSHHVFYGYGYGYPYDYGIPPAPPRDIVVERQRRNSKAISSPNGVAPSSVTHQQPDARPDARSDS